MKEREYKSRLGAIERLEGRALLSAVGLKPDRHPPMDFADGQGRERRVAVVRDLDDTARRMPQGSSGRILPRIAAQLLVTSQHHFQPVRPVFPMISGPANRLRAHQPPATERAPTLPRSLGAVVPETNESQLARASVASVNFDLPREAAEVSDPRSEVRLASINTPLRPALADIVLSSAPIEPVAPESQPQPLANASSPSASNSLSAAPELQLIEVVNDEWTVSTDSELNETKDQRFGGLVPADRSLPLQETLPLADKFRLRMLELDNENKDDESESMLLELFARCFGGRRGRESD